MLTLVCAMTAAYDTRTTTDTAGSTYELLCREDLCATAWMQRCKTGYADTRR